MGRTERLMATIAVMNSVVDRNERCGESEVCITFGRLCPTNIFCHIPFCRLSLNYRERRIMMEGRPNKTIGMARQGRNALHGKEEMEMDDNGSAASLCMRQKSPTNLVWLA